MRIGFSLSGVHSDTYEIAFKSLDRSLLPPVRPRTVEVFGKSGVIDYGNNDYGVRQIKGRIAFFGESLSALRSNARNIAAWLQSNTWEKLIFDDESDKYYLARIINGVSLYWSNDGYWLV